MHYVPSPYQRHLIGTVLLVLGNVVAKVDPFGNLDLTLFTALR